MANADAFNSGFKQGLGKSKGGDDGSDGGAAKLGKDIKSYKKGGRVRKTGVYRLHKGEEVVPAKKSRKKSRRKVSSKR